MRRLGYADVDGGRFVAYASGDAEPDTLVSSDGGSTWWRPSSWPLDCVPGGGPGAYGDILGNDETILMLDGDGYTCRSDDGGDTWVSGRATTSHVSSSGVWTGSEFWFWGSGKRFSSPDGVTWTETDLATDHDIGPVARGDDGTLVAVNNVWLGYGDQTFQRSTDGLTWEEAAFTGGHPIFFITSGWAEPSDVCP